MCDPRLKSQRMEGREREAGWLLRRGMSKRDCVAMPPEASNAVEMLRIWTTCVADILVTGSDSVDEELNLDLRYKFGISMRHL